MRGLTDSRDRGDDDGGCGRSGRSGDSYRREGDGTRRWNVQKVVVVEERKKEKLKSKQMDVMVVVSVSEAHWRLVLRNSSTDRRQKGKRR